MGPFFSSQRRLRMSRAVAGAHRLRANVAYPPVGVTGFIELTALLWWGVELWRTMNVAKKSRTKLLTAPFPLPAR